jgi:hypothetical protein
MMEADAEIGRRSVEVEMVRASVWYFGIALWAGLGFWFVVGAPGV